MGEIERINGRNKAYYRLHFLSKMPQSAIKIRKVCEFCGQEFYTKKHSTKYCSKKCNERAYKHRKRKRFVEDVEKKQQDSIRSNLKEQDYFQVKGVAKLMGLSPKSIYKMIYRGQLNASRITSRLTIIRRKDIESLLTNNPHQIHHRIQAQPIVDFYTTKEIVEKYNISPTYLYRLSQKITLPHVFKRKETYWSKKHLDTYFAKQIPDGSITEWYTAQEIMDKYGMTISAVYCMASDNNIPKKKEKRNVYYSKRHVDEVKATQKAMGRTEPEYYSIKEAMDTYNFTRNQVYHYCAYYDVPREKRGKFTYIDKNRFDEVVSPPIIQKI